MPLCFKSSIGLAKWHYKAYESMKHYILLIASFLFFNSDGFTQIQSGEVVYKIKERGSVIQEALDVPEVSSNIHALEFTKSYFADVRKALPNVRYRLNFTKNEASFQTTTKHMASDTGVDLNKALTFTRSNGSFYTNTKENLRLRQHNYLNKDWLIKDKVNTIEWEVTNKTKQIQGYTCYKAVADGPSEEIGWKKVIAWFAPEIPFQFGPLDYAGLPGLILEVEYGFYSFYADTIDFSNEDKNIKRPSKGELLDRLEYDKKIKELSDRFKRGSR